MSYCYVQQIESKDVRYNSSLLSSRFIEHNIVDVCKIMNIDA